MTTLLGKEAGHLEEGLDQALLTLNPLPLHAVDFGVGRGSKTSDIAKNVPSTVFTNEVVNTEEAYDNPIGEQEKNEGQSERMEIDIEEIQEVSEGPKIHETELEGKAGLNIVKVVKEGGEKGGRLRCQICRESFSNLYSLVTHEVEAHEGILESKKPIDIEFEPVRCYKCKAEMTLPSEVASHGCTQTKYSPTRCLACKKILVNKLQMTTHSCKPPPPSSQLACLSCGLEFTSLRRTIIHEVEECSNLARKGHSEFRLKVSTCNICDRHFVIRRKFKLHMERHKQDAEGAKSEKETTIPANAEVPDNIENIDPDMKKPSDEIVMEQIDHEEIEECGDVPEPESTTVHSKEGDFLKAVKQLQELYEGSCTCQHCGKILGSRKATLEHEVNVHGDVSNAENFFRYIDYI